MACKQFARRFAYSLLTMGHVGARKKSKVGVLVGLFSAISFLQLALSGIFHLLYFWGNSGFDVPKCIFDREDALAVQVITQERIEYQKSSYFAMKCFFSVSFWPSIFVAISRQFLNNFFSRYGLLKPCSSINIKQIQFHLILYQCKWPVVTAV